MQDVKRDQSRRALRHSQRLEASGQVCDGRGDSSVFAGDGTLQAQ